MLSAIAISASEKGDDYNYFQRGVYVSVDFAPGVILNERIIDRERNSSTGTDISIGYRFRPQLAIAVGTGAHGCSNRTWTCGDTVPRKVENTCVPVFVRVRSDLRDREVTPYLQMDIGYSFMDMYTRESLGRVQYASDNFMNGRNEYIEMNDSYIQYGMNGWFTSLDVGVSLHIIGRSRMNLGLCAGLHQAFLGTSFQTTDGEVLHFGREESLTVDDDSSVLVRIVGKSSFIDSIESFVRVKIGFTF